MPTPTVPPSNQPVASTVTSIDVRITRTDSPVRATRPVMRPSLGPGPIPTPMYSTVASALRTTPPSITTIRTTRDSAGSRNASVVSTDTAMTTTLAIVPNPGFCRIGIQSVSTTTPVSAVTTPKLSGVRSATPWWNTSHGSRPRPAVIIMAIEKPYSHSPANRAIRRRASMTVSVPGKPAASHSHDAGTGPTMRQASIFRGRRSQSSIREPPR
ncbi:hypothetical protein EP51_08265 [Rhodococcus opacus]|uniref:Uncharacterized protein n=1 Tax=Rhodococcus opacus TaxID=37919 RepID=A0A076EHL5_RHOOP|nr:hypothetical protein EP51_08265 [Rhodococcus opacus]